MVERTMSQNYSHVREFNYLMHNKHYPKCSYYHISATLVFWKYFVSLYILPLMLSHAVSTGRGTSFAPVVVINATCQTVLLFCWSRGETTLPVSLCLGESLSDQWVVRASDVTSGMKHLIAGSRLATALHSLCSGNS